jgi:hypothetical protein
MRIYVTGCQPLDPPVHSKDALMQSHDKMTKDGDLEPRRPVISFFGDDTLPTSFVFCLLLLDNLVGS